MSNIYFDVFRDDTIRLVRSVIIKFSESADQINNRLEIDQGLVIDWDDPTTWKYYMHLAGEYHSTDVMMYVISVDTLERIEFTKANLAIHRATARAYAPGTTLYKSLALEYPEQVDLITGILFPININDAIVAPDGKILYYDKTYIESQEDTLIYDLQDWVDVFYLRWYNQQFVLIDELFHVTFLGNLYDRMVPTIMAMRLAKAKTNKAHSYHIREYLASHNHLDDFIPYLDTFQMLWLYRNIDYLQRHPGSKNTFDRLVKNILTHRGIPIINFTLEQNSERLLEDFKATAEMVKHDINFDVVQDDNAIVSTLNVLQRESTLARDNPLVQYDTENEIQQDIGLSAYSILPTRVYDSELIDRSVSNIRSLESVLLNEWLELATSGRYRAFIQVPNPKTGTLMTMSVKDAFIVTMYCYLKVRDLLPETIPSFIAYDAMIHKSPTFMELREMSPKRIIPDNIITAIQDITPPPGDYISTELFYLGCADIHRNYLKQWELYSFQEHPIGRGYCEQIVRMHYMNRMCKLTDAPITWNTYLRQQGFDILDLSTVESEQLCMDTINVATGANLVKVITLGEIQRELLRLVARLSNYAAQFLRNVEFTKFNVIGIVQPRIGDISVKAGDTLIVPAIAIGLKAMEVYASFRYLISSNVIGPAINWSYSQEDYVYINPMVDVVETSFNNGKYPMPVCNIGLQGLSIVVHNEPDPNGDLGIYENPTDPNWPKFENT